MKKEFSKISDVINESVLKNAFGQALDKTLFFSFWKNIAGKRFEKVSIPYDLKGNVLFVSVANSTVAQELGFFKSDLIKNCTPYAKGLKLRVNNIIFNYKNWHEMSKSPVSLAFDEDYFAPYTEEDYSSVEFTEEEEAEFKKLQDEINKNEFLPEGVRKKFFNTVKNLHKARKLRNSGR